MKSFVRPRSLVGRVVVLLAACLVVLSSWHVAAAGAASGLPPGYTNTPYGPLGPSDIDLIVRVRQASLWETPAGQAAQTQSSNATVKQVGAKLAADHIYLNDASVKLAAQLGVSLPSVPTTAQQQWLAQLRGEYGQQFDVDFANLLRAAHGVVFSVIASVRAGTRNDLVRGFAETANAYVLHHIQLLESIGLVNYQALPIPAGAGSAAASVGAPNGGFVYAILAVGVLLILAAVIQMSRSGRRRRSAASW